MTAFSIIVIHRPPGELPDCLEAIRLYSGNAIKLYVVDTTTAGEPGDSNAKAGDGTCGAPYIVHSGGEQGVVQTCNAILKKLGPTLVAIVDSTVSVGDGWLRSLEDCLTRAPEAGIVGPLDRSHYDGLPADVCGRAALTGTFHDLNAALKVHGRHRRIAVRVPEVSCLAAKPETIQELGYLDETFRQVDAALADLCIRAELAGYRNFLAGDVYAHRTMAPPSDRGMKALRDKWESLPPESDLRKHYEALNLYHQAIKAQQREEMNRAVELYLQGIGMYPAEKKLYLGLATMLADAGQYADALQTLEELPGNDHPCEAVQIAGICQRGLKEPDLAGAAVASLLATDDQSAAGWWLKGALLLDAGNRDQARTAFQQSIAFDPGCSLAYIDLGNLAWNRDARETALGLFEQGFSRAPELAASATAYHTAIADMQAYDRAIPLFSEAAAVHRDNRRLRYLLIDLLLKAGRQEQAMGVIESALSDFGLEEGLLGAALAVRANIGPYWRDNAGTTVSFCLIIRDEEQDLPRCLYSIKPVADEIVVVDTGSDDRSADVAQVFGARVFDFKWCDDFSAARNFAAEKATGDWIFSLDADEVLSPIDHTALVTLLNSSHPEPVAYSLTTRNYLKTMDIVGWQANDGCYPEEDGLGWMPSEKVRLYPNDRRAHFVYPVHEMVEPSLEKSGISVRPCHIPVHHYGKLNQARSQAKGKAYFDIGLKKLQAMQTNPTGIRELAVQAQTLGDNATAVQLWERLLEISPGQAHTYINLGSAYLQMGDYGRAQEMACIARELDPSIKESHFNLALSMLHAGDARGAIGILKNLVQKQPDYVAATFILAAAYGCAGDEKQALATLEKLQQTSIAAGLAEALDALARGLRKADQNAFGRALENLMPG